MVTSELNASCFKDRALSVLFLTQATGVNQNTSTSSEKEAWQNSGYSRFGSNEADVSTTASCERFDGLQKSTSNSYWRRGMTISRVDIEVPNAMRVEIREDALIVELSDARTISVPLEWYPRLLHGTSAERRNWRLIGDGEGINWEDLDEDISVEGLLAGRRSAESQKSFQRWLNSRAAR